MSTIIFIVTRWWLWLLISIGLYSLGLFLIMIGANSIDENGNVLNSKAYMIIPGFTSIIMSYLFFILSVITLITMLIKYIVKG
jgi:hypothetical protein